MQLFFTWSVLARRVFGVLLLTLCSTASTTANAGHFKLISTFWEDTDPSYPSKWVPAKDGKSIFVEFRRRYKSDRCIGVYQNSFEFSVPFDKLPENEMFTVTVRKINADTPCGHKWTKAAVHGAGLLPKGRPAVPSEWEYNGNIEVINYAGDWHGTLPMYSPEHAVMEVFLMPKILKTARYTSMSIESGDNVYYFIYEYINDGSEPPTKKTGGVQKSTFGDIHWDRGYYGNPSKTITVEQRVSGTSGERIVRGRWGRTKSSDAGSFEFIYSDACTFTGTYWRGKGAKKTWKGWCDK